MSFIYSEHMLEPTEVKEDVLEVAGKINASEGGMFIVLTDFEGQPVVLNIVCMVKISETT